MTVTRRNVIFGGGALVVGFSLGGTAYSADAKKPALPEAFRTDPYLDSWIRVTADGEITVFSGKVELGQGLKTALLQIAAEELDVPFAGLTLITADTGLSPDEGFTSGSRSMTGSGVAIQNAAAQVRALLIAQAGRRWGIPADQLTTRDGAVHAPDGARLDYGALVSGEMLHVAAAPQSKLKDPASYTVMNTDAPRVDLPAKVTGGAAFVQDLRIPGMLHARVVRPPSYRATLASCDEAAVSALPGVVKVIRDGAFLAVVAVEEYQAIKAMMALAETAKWNETATLPDVNDLEGFLTTQPERQSTVFERGSPGGVDGSVRHLSSIYSRPYLAHGSIGPSCAVARFADGKMTVWTHGQGVYPLRLAIAEMLRMPMEDVRCIHQEGSGCYGHNGADDAAADAALIARALPDRPVRVQWMREQEHGWAPFGSAMVAKVDATVDTAGAVRDWRFSIWSHTHSTRPGRSSQGTPGGAGAMLAAQHMAQAFAVPPAEEMSLLRGPAGAADRNAIPGYNIPGVQVSLHFLPDMPVRVSALRSLGAYLNVFAIESAMDELAGLAGADPLAFRLKHMEDPRAREVLGRAAQIFGWRAGKKPPASHGHGIAFARYKNSAAYCAVAVEVAVDRETGTIRPLRIASAVDAGQAVNPDGIRNQIEGGIIQSLSWTMYEQVTFDRQRITSTDWGSYPILRFDGAPDALQVEVINRPGQPFLGVGEASQGPTAAALANAIAHAVGIRPRNLPIKPDRMKALLAQA